jgi:hypothetical protein
MTNDGLFTKAVSAGDFVNKWIAVAQLTYATERFNFHIATNVGGIQVGFQAAGDQLPSTEVLKQFQSSVASKPHILVSNATVHSNHDGNIKVQYQCSDGIVGKIQINFPGDPVKAARCLQAVENQFNVSSYIDVIGANFPQAEQSALQMRERSVSDLKEMLQKLAEFQTDLVNSETEHRRKLQEESDKTYQVRVDKLDQEYRQRQVDLDKLDQERRAEFERVTREADAALARREKEHQERVSQFQTHESKYMRRELLKKIEEVVGKLETMELSKITQRKRWWIHFLAWILLVAGGFLSTSMAVKILTSQQFDWHYLPPLSAGFVTFVFTMIYYLKWNDRWFREHADGEFAAKRYRADIYRASWLAELVTEWAKEAKGDLPPSLLEACTRNLFTDITPSRVSEHPMDHMLDLVKKAKEFKMGKDGISITASERGAAK